MTPFGAPPEPRRGYDGSWEYVTVFMNIHDLSVTALDESAAMESGATRMRPAQNAGW